MTFPISLIFTFPFPRIFSPASVIKHFDELTLVHRDQWDHLGGIHLELFSLFPPCRCAYFQTYLRRAGTSVDLKISGLSTLSPLKKRGRRVPWRREREIKSKSALQRNKAAEEDGGGLNFPLSKSPDTLRRGYRRFRRVKSVIKRVTPQVGHCQFNGRDVKHRRWGKVNCKL